MERHAAAMRSTRPSLRGLACGFAALAMFVPPVFAAAADRMSVTTSSKQAQESFAQGLAAYDRARPRLAVPFFDQALTADPAFAMASLSSCCWPAPTRGSGRRTAPSSS